MHWFRNFCWMADSEVVAQGAINKGKAIKKDDIWSIIVSQSAINEQ